MSLLNDYKAESPEELKQVLLTLLKQPQTNAELSAHSHYIHYQYGRQESLIRVNPSFSIFHYDLQGRPATEMVKNTILDFIENHCNSQGRFMDVSRQEMLERNASGFLAADGDKSRVVLSDEPMTLVHARARLDQASQMAAVAKAREHFGLFQASEESVSPVPRSEISSPSKKQR